MKKLAFLVIALGYYSQVMSQINFGKELMENTMSKDNVQKLKGLLVDKMANARKEYDEASFNYAVALSDNAGLYENEERYKKNSKILFEVVKVASGAENNAQEEASNLNEAGELLYASNKYRLAEQSFNSAMKKFEGGSLTSDPVYALTMSNLGLLYHTTGRYSLAEKYTDSALHLRESILPKESSPIAASINNLAVLYKDMARYNEAETQIEQALYINEKTLTKHSVPYALTLNNQAMIFQAMGRYKEAEPLLQDAIAIAGEFLKEKSSTYARLMINLAVLYQLTGRLQDAEVIYMKIIKIQEKKFGSAHPDYAHSLNQLASLYVDMGKEKYGEVENLLKKSAAIYKKAFGEQHPSYASAISNLGNFYRISGKPSQGEELLRNALATRKELLGEMHPDCIASVEHLGLLYWQMGKNIDAGKYLKESSERSIKEVELYFAALSESEKSRLWDKIRPRFQRFNSFVIHVRKSQPALGFDMYNYQLATKALILNSTNSIKQQILSSSDAEIVAKYKEWLDLKENLARLYTLDKQTLAQEGTNIDSLENVANVKEKELSIKSNVFKQGYERNRINYKNIVEKLNADEAAIEIVQLQKFNVVLTDSVQYVALILSKDKATGNLEVVQLNNGTDLEKKYYNYYKNCIKQKMVDEHSYKNYWENIEKSLLNKKTIYLSLDGIYNQINVATLRNPAGQYLIDSKNIITVTNTKEIIALKSAPKSTTLKNTAVLIGYPLYGARGTVQRLPGTKAEVEAIKLILEAKAFSTTLWEQEDASEANVKTVNNPRILHIATHGFFMPETDNRVNNQVFGIALDKSNENPLLRSGLLLADAEKAIVGKSETGILTAYEVSNLTLNKTDIVAVSACETGLGDVKNGEGVYGLQRAFRVAGAETIIMSLWKVDDTSTKELMSTFYKNYTTSGNKQQAFKNAQLSLREKYKEPYYWGAFVMVE